MKTKESIIEVLKKYGEKDKPFGGSYISYLDYEAIASELTEKESEIRTAEEILMGILESFDMYLRKAYGEIRFNYDDAAGFVKKLYISDEFAPQLQQPEITDKEIRKALENLIFTAGKLWDEVKPIKDTEIRIVTHPIIEEAKIVLASLTLQAQQPSDDRKIATPKVIFERLKLMYNNGDTQCRAFVAEICDEILDKTGGLLGDIRDSQFPQEIKSK